jgi:hypothetical protein
LISLATPGWLWSELIENDLKYSVVFDNSKIASYVPAYGPQIDFAEGARRIVEWREAHRARAVGDSTVNSIFDRLVKGYHEAATIFGGLA